MFQSVCRIKCWNSWAGRNERWPQGGIGHWLKTYIFSSENIPSIQFGHTRAFRFVLYFTVLTITAKSLKFRHAILETDRYLGNLEYEELKLSS